VVTALYRRYRPENFAELIGQSQVTDPLRTALRTNRVNHAYLFSGPRGCGKTTSARILARCLNCAEGPTDTPCGVCPSCVELARDGSGSLDVIEIDAASHNGVDDARDLRDRAVFAPARDRYKIFILDEAHMVTPQGFNALLKLVEEPPEHVKFIFATTEPEKVIGTIRSRTHHYPFRLVPPAVMLEYIEQLCTQESVSVAPGVLPLVVRAGGGSVRDTLSLLDQLMAGSEDGAIAYERAVALLGYTDAALLDDVVDALAVADPASAFAAIDRVVQTGQDPRRFVEDLLERLRDLIVVAATNESAAAVLRGVSPEELDTMSRQAGVFGATGLSRSADIANRALTEMTGATSPRLHLELMTARMLVPEADDTQRGALARVERLERRVGVGDVGGHGAGAGEQSAPAVAAAPRREQPAAAAPAAPAPSLAPTPAPAVARTTPERPVEQPAAPQADSGAVARDAAASWAAVAPSTPGAPAQSSTESSKPEPSKPESSKPAAEPVSPSSTGQGTTIGDEPAVRTVGAVGFQQMRDSWPQIVEHVQHAKRSAWSVVVTAQVTALRDDVLTLTFPSQQDVASFKEMSDPSASVSELLRAAIVDVLGLRVKFVARGPGQQQRPQQQQQQPAPAQQAAPAQRPAPAAQAPATAPTPTAAPATEPKAASVAPESTAAPAPTAGPAPKSAPEPKAAPTASAPQRDQAPAEPTPAPSGAPVTDWAVATIPASDPTADAVPESVEPSWAAPFGTVPASAPVAPAETSTPQPAEATPSAAPARPAGATAEQPDEPTTPGPQAASGAGAVPPGGPVVPGVPVDDYPLDDEPYDDGAPFPDPGIGRGSAPAAPAAAAPAAAAPAVPTKQAAPERPAQPTAAPARTAPPARRAPVAGRYGEAVVREILNAQFIEETALHQDGA
jgi:DNA polymerase-3 subunit gamma/tau